MAFAEYAQENLIMHIEKHKFKMFNTITIILLAAMLLTIIAGFMVQRQTLPARIGSTGIRAGDNFMPVQPEPELTQTSPTGRLVVNTGIILLIIGFIMIIILLVRRNLANRNTS